MILILDNYDSFTYNLVQLVQKQLQRVGEEVVVKRNDEISVARVADLNPRGILLSPGPGRPERAGICTDVVRRFGEKIPILGVCLGHQAIGAAFGARIVRAPELMHGRTSWIRHCGTSIFVGVGNPFVATRYHSLMIAPESLPDDFEVLARTDDGVIMSIRHKNLPLVGVQFHPESILTEDGEHILCNWLTMQESR